MQKILSRHGNVSEEKSIFAFVLCRKRGKAACVGAGRGAERRSAPVEVELLPRPHRRLCLQPEPRMVLILHSFRHVVTRTEA
jgi:hypothetical protein